MNDRETPEQRLDRMLRRDRRKKALLWGSIAAATLAVFIFFFGVERVPQGPETALVLSRSQGVSDDRAVMRYRIELGSGQLFQMSASPIHGINTGDTICVQRLRHPLFGGETIQRLPNSRCAPR